ncbi:hypothetical protein BHYA_0190g00260 [Botrytis hyacinthi]|uniref:Uncharacterized protein n=1 Tax=Botrytis hyacinthi TaxID=278943 RepID=A0A4Z1GEP5_9HELO|nr:hypothetical protein BHYA_0190g00260 [Botrytis hyacinthi]
MPYANYYRPLPSDNLVSQWHYVVLLESVTVTKLIPGYFGFLRGGMFASQQDQHHTTPWFLLA